MVERHQERQSPIDAHGIIGDLRTAALVNDQGSVDFFCWPEFDSPTIFGALLDTPEAGIFSSSRTYPTPAASRSTCPTATCCRPAG